MCLQGDTCNIEPTQPIYIIQLNIWRLSMPLPRLTTPQVTAYYEEDTNIARIYYRGEMSPEVIIEVYDWMKSLAPYVPIQDVRGGIYDFRAVTGFRTASFRTAQSQSQKFNAASDLSHIPVALLISTFSQEQMVRVAMQVTPQEHRKAVVRTEAEARAFIDMWHEQSAAT